MGMIEPIYSLKLVSKRHGYCSISDDVSSIRGRA